jgi:hypothetical protein
MISPLDRYPRTPTASSFVIVTQQILSLDDVLFRVWDVLVRYGSFPFRLLPFFCYVVTDITYTRQSTSLHERL